ncbi:MAG: class IV adenylate cyclase [Planctomycetota bacterium]|jgi:adenylate cyclase class 2
MAMGQMEVELKFAAADRDQLQQRLRELAARPGGTISQADEYYAHPARDFAATDEALRVRAEGVRRVLTYKGPKAAAAVKIREEIEAEFAAEQESDLKRILQQLGFRSVAVVAKTRQSWTVEFSGQRIQVEVDDVERLGSFVEIEVVTDSTGVAAAEAAIWALAQELQLTQASRASYLALLLGQADG